MNELLDIDVRLLLLRYGKAKVLQALAHVDGQSVDELERQLQAIQRKPKPKRAPASIMDLIAEAVQERPEIAEPLRALAIRFENRTFLPQLRDVQRFLDRTGMLHSKFKSRASAAPIIIRALTNLPPENLTQLLLDNTTGDSDYALLARAIMRGKIPRAEDK